MKKKEKEKLTKNKLKITKFKMRSTFNFSYLLNRKS